MQGFFEAKSVTLIGATHKEGKVGFAVAKNLLEHFKGQVYFVNPKYNALFGRKCYKSVLVLPKHVELAIIAVPNVVVPKVLEECGKAGIKHAIVLSAGFAETGSEGAKLQKEIVRIAKKHSMRFLGPNCFGIIDAHSGLNTSFVDRMPEKGSISIISQSGALLASIIDFAVETSLPLGRLISLGNMADVKETEMLEFLAKDPKTKVIALYIEGISNGRKFLKVAQKVSRIKPIVVLKSGKSEAGIKAVHSHTAALAGSSIAYSAAFKQSHAIETENIEEFLNFAKTFAMISHVDERLIIVTNAGGPGTIAADLAEKYGFKLVELENKEKLREILPKTVNIANPLDLLGDAKPERYNAALSELCKQNACILAIVTPQAMTEPIKVAEVLAEHRKHCNMASCFICKKDILEIERIANKARMPNFNFAEQAMNALHACRKYFELRERGKSYISFDVKEAAKYIESIEHKELGLLESLHALELAGIRVANYGIAKNQSEAAKIALQLSYPVVLKALTKHAEHKTELGLVSARVNNEIELRRACETIRRHAASFEGVLVQKFVNGIEFIAGSTYDEQFGNLIAFGLGGIFVELFNDVSFRIAPLAREDVQEMIAETKAAKLLSGFRGIKVSAAGIYETLLRLSALVESAPIKELDINPLICNEHACFAVDARIVKR